MTSLNIAQRMRDIAERCPHQRAVVVPAGRDALGRAAYAHLTFQQLDRESDLLARGLQQMGAGPGTRLVLMVRFGIEFVSLVFAAFKAGAVIVLIDPGMGLASVLACLEEVEPEGFLAIPPVQAARLLDRPRFPRARHNLTVGRRWFWGGPTYRSLVQAEWHPFESANTRADEPAAVIFTSGSTGPAKGVIYEHGMFDAQVDLIRDQYGIEPGGIDLACFPLFGLFNAAMGTTTIVPPMNPSRPARANPWIFETLEDQTVTQCFGSPALWNRVTRYCGKRNLASSTLRRAFSAGAAAPVSLLERMVQIVAPSDAGVHTPYGATEALPVTTISACEVLEQTAARTRLGAGTCVGRQFSNVRVKIIEITDEPIPRLGLARELATGQIGEIIVQGPSVTRRYLRNPHAEAAAKIADEPCANPAECGSTGESENRSAPPENKRFWHRMGDVGYFDDQDRLWYCGRKSQIVWTATGPLFTEQCEAVFNQHARVSRSALVGVGCRGKQAPAIVVESEAGRFPLRKADRQKFSAELRDLAAANPLTRDVHNVLFHRSLPVDARHNAKINRESLALWAANALHGRL